MNLTNHKFLKSQQMFGEQLSNCHPEFMPLNMNHCTTFVQELCETLLLFLLFISLFFINCSVFASHLFTSTISRLFFSKLLELGTNKRVKTENRESMKEKEHEREKTQ